MENLELWERHCITDTRHAKTTTFGRKFTAIDAMYQIKVATEEWGAFGGKWGIKNEKFSIILDTKCLYSAILYYPDSEICIHSDIEIIKSYGSAKGKYNEDWSKKIATDALTKGLSKLGFSADIFLGKWDDNKYIDNLKVDEKMAEKLLITENNDKIQKNIAELKIDVLTNKQKQIFVKNTLAALGVTNWDNNYFVTKYNFIKSNINKLIKDE